MAQISVAIAGAHSLKEKRMVIRRMKDRVRERLGVAIAEVGSQDVWQRAELGVSVASGERANAIELVDAVVRVIVAAGAAGGGDVVAIARDTITFDPAAQPWTPIVGGGGAVADERTGAGDKAGGDDWIPDAWRDEASR